MLLPELLAYHRTIVGQDGAGGLVLNGSGQFAPDGRMLAGTFEEVTFGKGTPAKINVPVYPPN
jgi:hypothetical protein